MTISIPVAIIPGNESDFILNADTLIIKSAYPDEEFKFAKVEYELIETIDVAAVQELQPNVIDRWRKYGGTLLLPFSLLQSIKDNDGNFNPEVINQFLQSFKLQFHEL